MSKGYRLMWAEGALERLYEMLDTIAERSPVKAAKVRDQLMARLALLPELPRMAPPFRLIPDPDIRQLVIERFRLIYQVNDEQELIILLAVQHGREDPTKALASDED